MVSKKCHVSKLATGVVQLVEDSITGHVLRVSMDCYSSAKENGEDKISLVVT